MSTSFENPKQRLEAWGDLTMDLDSSFNEKLNKSPEHEHLAAIFAYGDNLFRRYFTDDEEKHLESGKVAQKTEFDCIIEPDENQDRTQDLHCSCQTLYDDSKFYIQCDECNIWYHGECEDVTSEEADLIDLYSCKNCNSK
ncbi:unnamed protein product [Diamesa serratosioi]